MQNNDIQIVTVPKKKDIENILIWLKEEKDSNIYGHGFYCNRADINESFEKNKAIVLKNGSENIGLLTWQNNEKKVEVNIDIFVINQNYRRQGYGKLFYKAISKYFKEEGYKVIKLFCEPKSSEKFWIKMGLHKFPDCGKKIYVPDLTYYAILVDVASSSEIINADKIELWDVDPNKVNGKKPKWTWYIETKNEKLIYPIIQPCISDWMLRRSRNGKVLKEEKVKYFTDKDNELYSEPYLCIFELKE